jgi:hypothetical protein
MLVFHVRANVCYGSWPCENATMLNCDRRIYSSKTVLVAQHASELNSEIEPKNIILRRVSIFEFFTQPGSFALPPARDFRSTPSQQLSWRRRNNTPQHQRRANPFGR